MAIELDFSMPVERVIPVLKEVISERGKPCEVRVDIGPEFISKAFQNGQEIVMLK